MHGDRKASAFVETWLTACGSEKFDVDGRGGWEPRRKYLKEEGKKEGGYLCSKIIGMTGTIFLGVRIKKKRYECKKKKKKVLLDEF